MASASSKEVVVKTKNIVLSLTEEEARALTAVLSRIGGLGELRGLISNNEDSIYRALVSEVGRWTLGGVDANWTLSGDDRLVRY